MNFKQASMVAAALLVVGSEASAHASATITFAGINLAQNGVGTNFNGTFFGSNLRAGQSISQQFSYTVKIVDDGLSANRTWSTCLPLSLVDCGPAPTGFEQVQVELETFRDGREASPFIDFTRGPTQTLFEGASACRGEVVDRHAKRHAVCLAGTRHQRGDRRLVGPAPRRA